MTLNELIEKISFLHDDDIRELEEYNDSVVEGLEYDNISQIFNYLQDYDVGVLASGESNQRGGADEILDQMRSLTGGHAHVFLRRKIEGRSALHPL